MQHIGFGDGHDGAIPTSGVINTYSSMSATSGQKTVTTNLSVSVGDIVLLHQSRGTGFGEWELVKVAATGSGEFTADRNLANTYTDSGASQAQAILVPQYTGGTVTGTITADQWNGDVGGIVAFLASGNVVVTGSISVEGKGFRGGTGIAGGAGPGPATQGESELGTGSLSTSRNGSGGGGAAQDNTAQGGTAHQTDSDLSTKFVFGGAGGGGHSFSSHPAYSGGNSGGCIFIAARSLDCSSGSINADGADGSGNSGVSNHGGGGGGAGGCVIIKSQTAVVGTNKISADGGSNPNVVLADTGGGGAGVVNGEDGSANNDTADPTSDGVSRIEACSITGTTSAPTASESEGGQDWCTTAGFIY